MHGLLLLNLGTPSAPTTSAVRRYLRQFLSDPRVVDMNPVGRALLLNLVILPLRPRRSAAAYRAIWTERGSPLLVHTHDLAAKVAARLGPRWRVSVGMRYGSPSIAEGLSQLLAEGVTRVVAFPLFPQYSSAATGSALAALHLEAARRIVVPPVTTVAPFCDHSRFIEAFALTGAPVLDAERPDHVLFSFHGLPERQVAAVCQAQGPRWDACCADLGPANRDCYRAQCFATARALARRLGLAPQNWSVSFQSRLGRMPWIGPHTESTLPKLAASGVRRLAVFCPAFVADCLETLEEIGIRGRTAFLAAGGEAFALVPSLNASDPWADAVAALALEAGLYSSP